MQFTIEVDDFWIEEEELSTSLTSCVTRDVLSKIQKSIEDKVEEQIASKITEVIEQKLVLVIDNKLTDLIATGNIKPRHSEEISLTKHITNMFEQNHGWTTPEKQMQKIAKEFGAELKAQYNNIFANKIVQNMKEQGLLKDEVVQILLGND